MPLEATLRLAPIRSIPMAGMNPEARADRPERAELERRRLEPAPFEREAPPLPAALPREGGLP